MHYMVFGKLPVLDRLLLEYTLFDPKFSNILAHPFRFLELFDELGFYVGNNTVTKVLSLGGKCLLNVEFAEDPT